MTRSTGDFTSSTGSKFPLFYLRLLGGLVLEEDGEAVTGRAAQKRRLALLALLAAAPGRALSRDRITGMLWPDKDAEQGRHLLSVAAYEIRKELGEDAIVSRGDDVVLDSVVVGSDLDDFRAAIDAGDHDAAAALYRGPFLDGFYVGGSSEFEHWLDGERAALARSYRNALVARAEALEDAGDHAGAADAWRKAANEDRFDSRIALRLLRALDAAGNRAGALQFARIHEALLQEEFGTAPAPEFTGAVAEIRARTAPAAPAAERRAPEPEPSRPAKSAGGAAATAGAAGTTATPAAADELVPPAADTPPGPPGAPERRWILPKPRRRDVLAVAAVAVVVLLAAMWPMLWSMDRTREEDLRVLVLPLQPSDSADEPFADGLSESIMDALAQVERVRVPAWSAAVALRGVNAPEAARRTGVDYVVEGSVRRDADSLRIGVRLVGTDGDVIWNDSYDRSAREMRRTWDEIARAVLTSLEIELGGAQLAAAAGDTESDVARDRFEKGRHAWLKRTPDGLSQAIRYFHQAVAADPGYARAHAALADAYNLMGDYLYGVLPPDSAFPLARRSAERALQMAPQLGEAHAALGSVLYQYDRDFDAADRAYRRAIELKPHYAEAHHWYSLFLLASGREEEAAVRVQRAIELDSLSPVMRTSLARHQYFRGDPASALAEYERALRIEPGFITAHLGRGVTLLELGRHDEALVAFDRVDGLVDGAHPLSLALAANAHGRAGRPDEARAILRQLEAARADGRWIPPEWFALVHIGVDDHDAAIAAFERALERGSSSGPFFDIEPLAAPLRDDPRFQRLIQRGKRPARR